MPPKFRKDIEDGLVLTMGADNCITAYTKADWSKMTANDTPTGFLETDNARKLSRFIFSNANEIQLDIEDDGKGFDIRSALKRTEDGRGLGLMGMKERVYLRDGKVLICSEPGSGTRISLWIPLKSPGDENV